MVANSKAGIVLNGLWAFNGNITVSVLDPYTRIWVYDETLSILSASCQSREGPAFPMPDTATGWST